MNTANNFDLNDKVGHFGDFGHVKMRLQFLKCVSHKSEFRLHYNARNPKFVQQNFRTLSDFILLYTYFKFLNRYSLPIDKFD